MQNNPPFYLNLSIPLCRLLSDPITLFHYCILRSGFLKIPLCIYNAPGGSYKNLRRIWFSRVLRRVVSVLVRTPLRNKILQLVNVTFPVSDTGSVIALCHTPWSRLLAQWCLENNFALIITGNKWDRRTNNIRRSGQGPKELRQLIMHLRAGGKIIIMADVFNNLKSCSANFLGKDCNVSLLPVRLAKIAKVPLIAAVPEVQNGIIQIHSDLLSDTKTTYPDSSAVMRNCISFFEKEIRRDPSIWSVFVRGSLSKYQRELMTVCQ